MSQPIRAAFYDFDGTLVSSNVVTRYAYFAKNHPSKLRACLRYTKLLVTVPFWIGLDMYSRRLFNLIFYREYRGLDEGWLGEQAEKMFDRDIAPKVYPGAESLLEADRHFGFDDVICNRLVYQDGVATGEIAPPLLAEQEKLAAIERFCREYNVDTAQSKAYSDSYSDVPMLEAVGLPAAVNPDRRLQRVASQRGWPVLNLKAVSHGQTP